MASIATEPDTVQVETIVLNPQLNNQRDPELCTALSNKDLWVTDSAQNSYERCHTLIKNLAL